MILSLEAMLLLKLLQLLNVIVRGRSRAAAPSKMKHSRPLTLITKHSILDVAAVVDPTLIVKNDKMSYVLIFGHMVKLVEVRPFRLRQTNRNSYLMDLTALNNEELPFRIHKNLLKSLFYQLKKLSKVLHYGCSKQRVRVLN